MVCGQAAWVILLGAYMGGCGDGSSNANAAGGGNNASGGDSVAGSSASGASGTGAGGTASAGRASGGTASGGAAAAAPLDCTGDFGSPTNAIAEVDGIQIASPTLSPDQRELIYTRIDYGTTLWTFVHALRGSSSEAFSPATALPELDAACQTAENRSIDLSSDGLRAYIDCYSETPGSATLHVADRASLQASFVVRATSQPIGGSSAAISTDELTLYSNDDTPVGVSPLRYQRATTNDDFGPAQPISELAGVSVFSVDPSPDGLALYAGVTSSLGVVRRSSVTEKYGLPTVLVAQQTVIGPPRKDYVYGAPELSHDCRSLYFVQQDTASPSLNGSILVLKR